MYLGGKYVPESQFRAQSFPEREFSDVPQLVTHPRGQQSPKVNTKENLPADSWYVLQMRWEQEGLAHQLLMTNGGRTCQVWGEETKELTALF